MTTSHRFRGGPEADDLRRWVAEGKTDEEIGIIVGRALNTDPATKQAVAYWRAKYGIKRTPRRPDLDHSKIRPWKVKIEHVGDAIEHRLYDYSRRAQGRELSPQDERLLEDFLAFLRHNNVVVDYDPETVRGWLLRRRDPEVDHPDSLIRVPSK